MKQYLCDMPECENQSDWDYIEWGEEDHTICDSCFAKLDPIDQLDYEPLWTRDYSEYLPC